MRMRTLVDWGNLDYPQVKTRLPGAPRKRRKVTEKYDPLLLAAVEQLLSELQSERGRPISRAGFTSTLWLLHPRVKQLKRQLDTEAARTLKKSSPTTATRTGSR